MPATTAPGADDQADGFARLEFADEAERRSGNDRRLAVCQQDRIREELDVLQLYKEPELQHRQTVRAILLLAEQVAILNDWFRTH